MIRLLRNTATKWAAKEVTGTLGNTILRTAGRAILWPFSHLRLMIEYVLIAALITTAATVLVNRTKMAEQDGKINVLKSDIDAKGRTIQIQAQVNAEQDAAIKGLQDLRKRDEHALLGLRSDLQRNRDTTRAVDEKLLILEKNNAAAKSLLSIPVADDIGCVLDNRPCPAHASSAH